MIAVRCRRKKSDERTFCHFLKCSEEKMGCNNAVNLLENVRF